MQFNKCTRELALVTCETRVEDGLEVDDLRFRVYVLLETLT